MEIVRANKDRFRKRALATAKVISLGKMLSPKKKHTSKVTDLHKKNRRKSVMVKMIEEACDSKEVAVLPNPDRVTPADFS